MVMTRIWLRTLLLMAASALAACGGASFGDGSGGLLGGGGGGTGIPAIVQVSASQETAFADGTSTVLISAVLTDAGGAAVGGRTINFATDAGTLVSSSATTNANGLAQVFLRAPTSRGTATVVARESETDLTGSVAVEFVAGLVQRLTATLSPTKIAPRAVAVFTVTALDSSDNPVPGQSISFETVPNGVGGAFNPTTVATDENGRAETAFEVGPETGTFTLRARTASGVFVSAQLTVATQAALLLSVTPSQPSIFADGLSTAVISAVLTDSSGTPVPNRPIDFTTNAGQLLQRTATTDANGLAEVTLRSSTLRGIATIVARDATTDVSGSTAVQFVTGQASQLTTTLSPTTVAAGGATTFIATVRDSNGNPVVGEIVSFDTIGGSGQFEETTVETNANGRAETTFIAQSVGTTTLRARTAGGLSSTGQLTVLQPDLLLALTATPNTATANGSSVIEITAQLRDFNDNPISNRTVTFTTNLGSLLAGSALTNDAGIARVNLRAPSQSGTARVTAQVSGSNATSSVAVEFTPGAASQINLVVNPTTIAPGGTAAVNASVRDASGNPVAGEEVTFAVSPVACGAFSTAGATTGQAGAAGTTFTAGNTTGPCTISASTVSGLNASVPLTVAVGVTGITMIAGAPTLQSSADTSGEGVTISAIVRKQGNQPVPGVTVSFSASSGLIQPLNNGTTDASGTAQAILTTGGDQTNRDITVTATSEGSTGTVVVRVVGTKITLDGPRSIQSGVSNTYVVTLTDAVSAPIPNRTVNITATGGTLSASTLTTDAQGKASFTLNAVTGPTVTLSASALGATSDNLQVSVTTDSLTFVPPDDGNPATPEPTCAAPQALSGLGERPLNTVVSLRVLWCRSGAAVAGSPPVTFSTTRGTLSAQTVALNASGFATVSITAAQNGPVTVSAVGNDVSTDPDSTPIASVSGEFVATVPAVIDVQADPAVIGINQQSTIRAIVRDASNNLVKNATVTFILTDVTGGSLSAGSGVTDSQGRTSVVYSASDTTSAQNGVEITARVNGISDAVRLTVGGQNLRIVLGTGNQIRESDDTTRYELPYTAIVSDAAGNPAPSAQLRLSGFAETYSKGFYTFIDPVWVPTYTVTCPNEDFNENGILDPGEDTNGNGILDPSAPAVISPPTPALNPDGFAFFNVIYPQDRANWISTFRLTARASAAGTETTEVVRFALPPSADDVNDEDVAPPGIVSPFGTSNSCFDTN